MKCLAAAAEFLGIGIEHELIGSGIRHADLVILALDRHEIAHGNDLLTAVVDAAERDHALTVVVVGDPAKALPGIVVLPERSIFLVEFIERFGKAEQIGVIRIIQHEPFQLVLVIPFSALTEFLSHEQELLARMREHIGKECAVGGELVALQTRHFLDHRALAVNDLVMRDRQDIVLGEAVEERECQLVMIECTVERIHRHIRKHVIHPAHVPFEIEAEAADIGRLGDERPCSRFLCDHQHIGMPAEYSLIELLQECNCFEILSAAVNIRAPFAASAVVVEIEHRGNRVHAQAVDMEFIEPVACRGDQERADLGPAVIKDARAPALVLALERIGVLIEASAVELIESLLILGEVSRHPVEDNADAGLMEHVDHPAEVIGRAEAGGRGKIARDLIAPRAVKRVFRQRHELDMRIGQILHIRDDLSCKFDIVQGISVLVGTPRGEMHLIYIHRRLIDIGSGLLRCPLLIMPRIFGFIELGRVLRRSLEMRAVGVVFQLDCTGFRQNAVLIECIFRQLVECCLPDAVRNGQHRMAVAVPVVEIADDRDIDGIGSPDAKDRFLGTVANLGMSAEKALRIVVLPLIE